VEVLRNGGLLVYPTETVYGLGTALGAGDDGVTRVRRAKGSPMGRPFLVLVAEASRAFALWSRVSPLARRLADSAWPGPLTLIGPARNDVPLSLAGRDRDGSPTLSVRVPGDARLRALLDLLDDALISTSANRAGEPSAHRLEDVPIDALRPDLVIDGGDCPGGPPSTLISLVDSPRVVRLGAWTPDPTLWGPS
jgi:L-threonylcarbamoyladenylate synthase